MSKKLASLLVKISANAAEVEKVFATVEKRSADLAKSLDKWGSKMTKNVTAPLTALGAVAVKLANDQAQAEAKLLTALKGREDAQQRLIASAAELQSRTTIGDEDIIAQQAYLASLGMTETQIRKVVEASVQLSAATGMSLDAAVKNLAKTYGGLTGELGESIPALKNLTEEELRNGAAVDFINENYKGFAETAARTGAGPLLQFKNRIGDLAERLGTALLPIIEKLVGWLSSLVGWLEQLSPQALDMVATIGAVVAVLGPLASTMSKVVSIGKTLAVTVIPQIGSALRWLVTNPIAAAITAVAALAYSWKSAADSRAAYETQKAMIANDSYNKLLMSTESSAKERASKLAQDYIGKATTDDELRARISHAQEMANWAVEEFAKVNKTLTVAELVSGSSEARSWWDKDYKQYFYVELLKLLQDELRRREESARILDETTKEYGKLLDTEEEELGILGELQEKLAKLEKQKPFAKTLEDLAAINVEIAKLNEQIDKLSNTTFVVTPENNKPVTASTPAPELNKLTAFSPVALKDLDVQLVKGEQNIDERIRSFERKMQNLASLAQQVSSVVQQAFVSIGTTIGEGIAAIITGADFDGITALITIFADALKNLGQALLTFAATEAAAMIALKSGPMGWIAAAAAGVAAIAAGTALSAVAKKPVKLATGGLAYGPTLAVVGDNQGASYDPEVIAPLSKLRGMMGGQCLELVGEINWTLEGDSLRAVLDRNNLRAMYRG